MEHLFAFYKKVCYNSDCKGKKVRCPMVSQEKLIMVMDYIRKFSEENGYTPSVREIAKECGCKFYLGSDAHHPEKLDLDITMFQRAIDYLGLEEKDKFRI